MIERLTSIVTAPAHLDSNPPIDWAVLEERLDNALPDDYRLIFETFGDGAFAGYLWLLSPTTNENISIDQVGVYMRWALAYLKERDPSKIPYDVRPQSRELVPCATTIDGDMIFWHAKDSRCFGSQRGFGVMVWSSDQSGRPA